MKHAFFYFYMWHSILSNYRINYPEKISNGLYKPFSFKMISWWLHEALIRLRSVLKWAQTLGAKASLLWSQIFVHFLRVCVWCIVFLKPIILGDDFMNFSFIVNDSSCRYCSQIIAWINNIHNERTKPLTFELCRE